MTVTEMLKEIWAQYDIDPMKYAALQLMIAQEKRQHVKAEVLKLNLAGVSKREERAALSCSTCEYYKPDNNPVCSSCFARGKHVLAT